MLRNSTLALGLFALYSCGGALAPSADDQHLGQEAVCGNGVLDPGEQCDDGNTQNLDGCDSQCRFEQDLRANSVAMQFGTDSFCTANALGGAIGSQAQTTVQNSLGANVAAGSLSMGFVALGLDDLTGAAGGSFKLGALSGAPFHAPPLHHYNGARDLDWWYRTDAAGLDSERRPIDQLDARIAGGSLRAGPGRMNLTLALGGGLLQLAASGVVLQAAVGPASAPTAAHVATPGHLPAEHVDPSLTSFASLSGGELCANLSAASLAQEPAPPALQSGGAEACDEGYGPANSMLDVLVGGCTVYGFVSVIAATQPDQVDPDAPAAGSGGPYQLSASAGQVTACSDAGGNGADLSACLRAAAYSTALTFTADRVIFK